MVSPYTKRGERDKAFKVFTVRTSGSVFLFGPELEIVDTDEFQRLAGIKQLGTSYFVFRGAVHSRLEHALGAVHTAQKIIDAVNGNVYAEREIGEREVRLARLFALLHDIGHISFGHTLEDEFGLLKRHDRNPERLERLLWGSSIGEILTGALTDEEFDVFRKMMEASSDEEIANLGTDAFLVDIVANTVCADAIDYVQRDLEACGMPGELGERFLDFFIITPETTPNPVNRNRMALALDKRGMPRPDVESEVVKLLSYRYELAERVYFHHAKNAASVMIGRGVQALGLHCKDENFDWLSDDVLLEVLRAPDIGQVLQLELTTNDDDRAVAIELGNLLHRRELFKIAYLGVADDFEHRADDVYQKWGTPGSRRGLEDLLADLAGVPRSHALAHLPKAQMAEKYADVRVSISDGTVIRLQDWDDQHSGRVSALNQAHRRLWRVAVYVHPSLSGQQKRLVTAAAEETFGVPSRYVPDEGGGAYLAEVFNMVAQDKGWGVKDHVALAGRARAKRRDYSSFKEAVELIDGLIKARRAPTQEG